MANNCLNVRLHPAHFQKVPGFWEALSWSSAPPSRAERLRVLREEASAALADCEADNSPVHSVWHTQSSLVLRGPGAMDVQVPMLLAEVSVGTSEKTSVVTLARPGEVGVEGELAQDEVYDVWMFVISGGKDELDGFLAVLTDGGVVRGDFQSCFKVPEQPLDYGSTANIYKVRRLQAEDGNHGSALAAKVIPVTQMLQASAADAEAELLFSAQGHPNIARLHGIFFAETWVQQEEGQKEGRRQQSQQVLLMDLYKKGSILSRLSSHGLYKETDALLLAQGLFSALAHIHDRGIVHRDLKPENVLLGKDDRPILTDFGIAAFVSDACAMSQRCGSIGYAAPEMLSMGKAHGQKVDIFGVGAVVYFALFCLAVFRSDNEVADAATQRAEVVRKTLECNIDFPGHRSVSEPMARFLRVLLSEDPEERPAAPDALDMVAFLQRVVPPSPPAPAARQFRSEEAALASESGPGAAEAEASAVSPKAPAAPPPGKKRPSRAHASLQQPACGQPERQEEEKPLLAHSEGRGVPLPQGDALGPHSEGKLPRRTARCPSNGSTTRRAASSTRGGAGCARPAMQPEGKGTPSLQGGPCAPRGEADASGFGGTGSSSLTPRWLHRGRKVSAARSQAGARSLSCSAKPIFAKFCPSFIRGHPPTAGD